MKHLFLLTTCLIISFFSLAQINGPDTVCVNTPATFTSGTDGREYTWILDRVNLTVSPTFPAPTIFSGTPMVSINFMSLTNDNGNWYALLGNYNNNPTISRLDFGNSLDNTPVGAGTFNVPGLSNPEGVEVLKENGNYYGFVVSRKTLIRLDFGNSMTNTPTTVSYTFNDMSWPHQLNIKQFGNEYIGFVGDRGGHIWRLEFGTSITNAPTLHLLTPTGGAYHDACNFALYNQDGNWYMLATNITSSPHVLRLDLGTNLKNDKPALTYLGNPSSGSFNITRSIIILDDCDALYAIAENENGQLFKLDFNNDITTMPVITLLGSLGPSNNGINVYTSNHEIKAFVLNWSANAIKRLKLADLPASSTTSYTTNSFTHTFTTAGTYDLTLYVDQGGLMGPSSFCKKVVVLDGYGGHILGSDTALCTGDSLTLDATTAGATGYIWNNGATTPSIDVNTPGTYWVSLQGNVCTDKDTITIVSHPNPVVELGNDTSVCNISSLTLQSAQAYVNPTYKWNTNATSPSINVSQTGMYKLAVTENGCVGTDSIQVTFDTLQVHLINDTALCKGASITLKSSVSYSNPAYSWNTGAATSSITVNQAGTYKLSVTDEGCTGSDSVQISITEVIVELGPDTTLCDGKPYTLKSLAPAYVNPSYQWSNGATTPTTTVDQSGDYKLTVTDRGCQGSDSMHLTIAQPFQISLGNDTVLCNGETITLRPIPQMSNASYKWSNGARTSTLPVDASGNYWLQVTDQYGCFQYDSVQVTYVRLAQNLGNDLMLCREEPVDVTLYGNVPEGAAALWSNGETSSSIEVKDSGTYWLMVSYTPCMGSDTITINTKQCNCQVYMPNAFSPNGDGTNDVFRPVMDAACPVMDYHFRIFNRWGQQVYYSAKPGEGWNGHVLGKKAELGTYMYVVTYTVELTHEEKVLKGDVILIR